MTGHEDDNEDHDYAPAPEDNHKDNHKDDHEDDSQGTPKDVPMSTKKPPSAAKAASTKPALPPRL